jgi:DNA-binding response OmpR family regulator
MSNSHATGFPDQGHGPLQLLVVEDDWLIASFIAEQLVELGYRVVGPATTIAEAVRLTNDLDLDAALVDADIHGKFAGELAELLVRRKIPFLFVSGYPELSIKGYASVPILQKPFKHDSLRRVVESMLPKKARNDQMEIRRPPPDHC